MFFQLSAWLPARFASIAAPATAATRSPAAPPTAAARAPAATTASSEAAAATTTAAAEAAIGFRTRFVHVQCPAVQGVAVEGGNRLIRLAFVFHFNECESAGAACFAIRHDSGAIDLAVPFEEAADALFGGIEVQVAYEYVLHSSLLSI
jgi:hypothetical protein